MRTPGLGPAEEGVVYLEGDVVVVVGVAAEQEGAGVGVEWVGEEPVRRDITRTLRIQFTAWDM